MTARVSDELDRHAIPFITAPDDDGGTGISSKFEVNPDAVAYLESLKGKVAVVAIAGLYRTGKSYLLNAVRARLGRPSRVGIHDWNAQTQCCSISWGLGCVRWVGEVRVGREGV